MPTTPHDQTTAELAPEQEVAAMFPQGYAEEATDRSTARAVAIEYIDDNGLPYEVADQNHIMVPLEQLMTDAVLLGMNIARQQVLEAFTNGPEAS